MDIKAICTLSKTVVGLQPSTQAVLWQLVASTQDVGYVTSIGQESIAKYTGFSIRTVARAFDELRDNSIIAHNGWSKSHGVNTWRIDIHATDGRSIADLRAADGVSIQALHAIRDHRHATCDERRATHGMHTKSTKITNGEKSRPTEVVASLSEHKEKNEEAWREMKKKIDDAASRRLHKRAAS
tara:strand:- start:1319 stop:1870 length:552 start_codon:yes stop_codon:yes gene_type:complete